MPESNSQYAVMFADIAQSTKLYDLLGDQQAEVRINDSIAHASSMAQANQGRIIKTVGDELMTCFPSANDAVNAALEIQKHFSEGAISWRIGMHFGDVIEKGDDLFGDTVNMASRMTDIASAQQIITTETLVLQLDSKLLSIARLFDKTKVKGKDEKLNIYQINWEEGSRVTQFISLADTQTIVNSTMSVLLEFAGEKKTIVSTDITSPVRLGRESCDITISSDCVSRLHADLDFRRGKFVLIDHSTNGTYVRFKDQNDVFIRREELPLMGEGVISLGESVVPDSPELVRFRIIEAAAISNG